MPAIKELDFFVDGLNWRRGPSWYRAQFSRAPSATLALGEVSTSYTMYPHYEGVAERIARLLPNARLIYVLRDPVERIRSHYQHNATTRVEHDPIDKAVLENPVYVNCSRYALQIEQYLQHFRPDQIMILASERLRVARRATMRHVFEFIGVDPAFVPPNLERDFYTSRDRAAYPAIVALIRRGVKRHLPWVPLSRLNSLRRATKVVSGPKNAERSEGRVELRSETRAQLESVLGEDQERLAAYLVDHPFARVGIP